MDPKRAHMVLAIQQALAAARACGDVMTDYLLEMALQEALRTEREEIRAKTGLSPVSKPPTIN